VAKYEGKRSINHDVNRTLAKTYYQYLVTKCGVNSTLHQPNQRSLIEDTG
jgi:hypothetical protein